jgi:hypothetical protein
VTDKIKYEQPKLINLNGHLMSSGVAFCMNGSGATSACSSGGTPSANPCGSGTNATGGMCMTGTNAGSTCASNGNSAIGNCQYGSYASGTCLIGTGT